MKLNLFLLEYLLVDVVHHFVVSATRVDPGDDARRQAVHQLAQDNAIPKRILKGAVGRESFTNHSLDPVLSLALLLWLPLTRDLGMDKQRIRLKLEFN